MKMNGQRGAKRRTTNRVINIETRHFESIHAIQISRRNICFQVVKWHLKRFSPQLIFCLQI